MNKGEETGCELIITHELCCNLREPVRTSETSRQYRAMTKAQRGAIKDRGGFFAGTLRDTRRKKAEVVSRSMITFDCDHINFERLEIFLGQRPVCAVTYTTHSHTPEAPRARVLLPLTRDVVPDEYNAVARYLAAEIGMDMIDPCSFEINQMMYWPTASTDGEYIFNMYEGETLDPDAFLAEYPNWRDWTSLPMSAREKKAHELPKKNHEDPLTKVGVVGDFCRVHTIQDAIAKYLGDVYEPSAEGNRYDYIPGEGRCGVVIYDDKFAYSHHGTDPAGGRLLNAFDLVRIHRFGDEPSSYRDMCELALRDEEVIRLNREERQSQALDDFTPDTRPDYSDWGQPISLDDEALPLFPMDALPEVLRDYAAAVAESTQTANEMSAVAILSTVSAAMRNLYKVEGKPDWREPTNIYGLIIAEPSERKSAVISLITKPIDKFVHSYNEEHKVEMRRRKRH